MFENRQRSSYSTKDTYIIRTIEVLASKCKIVTTNSSICSYDFFNKQNIHILDRENPVIPDSFFSTPFMDLDEKIIEKYSIYNWCKSILEK